LLQSVIPITGVIFLALALIARITSGDAIKALSNEKKVLYDLGA
jgi:hypothetical protein